MEHVYEKLSDNVEYRRSPMEDQKKMVRYSQIRYNFMQYYPIVHKWALQNHDLTNMKLELLMYAYPIAIFSKEYLKQMQDELGIMSRTMFLDLEKGGWLKLWSKDKGKSFFVLSSKANMLISRVHRMLLLEEPIPTSPIRNVAFKALKRGDKSLMNLYKEFNKKVTDENEK